MKWSSFIIMVPLWQHCPNTYRSSKNNLAAAYESHSRRDSPARSEGSSVAHLFNNVHWVYVGYRWILSGSCRPCWASWILPFVKYSAVLAEHNNNIDETKNWGKTPELCLKSEQRIWVLRWKSQNTGSFYFVSLRWRHNDHDSVWNHQPHDYLLNRLFRPKSKKTPKLRVTGLCEGNSPVTGEFSAQRANNAENVSIWWRHHVLEIFSTMCDTGCDTTVLKWESIIPRSPSLRPDWYDSYCVVFDWYPLWYNKSLPDWTATTQQICHQRSDRAIIVLQWHCNDYFY